MKRLVSAIAIALLLAACTGPSTGASPVPNDSAAPASTAAPASVAPGY